MSLFLGNPAWLWLLALGAVPLLVHLFARSNPPRYAFSNTEFLKRIVKKTARLRKPQDWLMLLLRTLAVLAIVAAFLQPLLTGESKLTTGKKSTVFIIDRSASMGSKDGSTDRFSAACQKVAELLKSGNIDYSNIIWMDAIPDAAFPQPGPNTEYLRDLLSRVQVRKESGAIAAALSMAVAQLELAEGSRELVIVSDFQSKAWQDFKLETPPGIEVVKVKVGQGDQENLAVHSLVANPSEPVVGQDVMLVCRVKNYSATPRRTTLYLETGGARQSKELDIAAWGESETTFLTRYSQSGPVSMTARISGDSFPSDDLRHAIVRVRDALRLVSVAPSKASTRQGGVAVLDRLSASLEWLDHRVMAPESLPQNGVADYVFFHDWNGQDLADLRMLSASGSTVIVYPAKGVSQGACSSLLGAGQSDSADILPIESAEKDASFAGWQAGISTNATNSRVFNLFRSGEFGNPVGGHFKQRFRLGKSWTASVTQLIDYRDGVPGLLLSSPKDSAPILLWNLPLSPSQSTWSGQSSFLPFMAELLLSSRAAKVARYPELLPGGQISWTPSEGLSPESIALVHDDKQTLETELGMTGQGPTLTSRTGAEPGIYSWKIGDGVVHQQVANFPNVESDLRTINPDRVTGGEVADATGLLRRAALGDGVPLWPWLIACGFVFLAIEALVGIWKPKPIKES